MIGGVSIWMSINPDIQYNSVKLDISDMEIRISVKLKYHLIEIWEVAIFPLVIFQIL